MCMCLDHSWFSDSHYQIYPRFRGPKIYRLVDVICSILELYVKYGKDKPEFNGTHCLIDIMIEDFINAMSVLYHKGHFILGAEMEDNFNFALYPDVGTEMGMCKTIKPMVRKTES